MSKYILELKDKKNKLNDMIIECADSKDALKYKRAALKQGYSVKIIKGGSHDETGTNRV